MFLPLDPVAHSVLAHYGVAVEGLRWAPLGAAGGFSGANLWRGEDRAGSPVFALKAWPPGTMSGERLTQIHAWMRLASYLPFVPAVLPTREGTTVVAAAGRVWDLTRWLPGAADFHSQPTRIRLTNACTALARFHLTLAEPASPPVPCPGVARRLNVLADWRRLQPVADRSPQFGCAELDGVLRRARQAVSRLTGRAEEVLQDWYKRKVLIQPCLCDVWRDHVLFTGDTVTGLIDYGAMKRDFVGVDLARLLGDLVGGDRVLFQAGLDAYRLAGGVLDTPDGLTSDLDWTGVVCGAIVWVIRLGTNDARHADPRAVADRLAQLVTRLEGMGQSGGLTAEIAEKRPD